MPDWRRVKRISGGGIVMDYGWHLFYVVRTLLRSQTSPQLLGADLSVPADWDVENAALVRFVLDGSTVAIDMRWNAQARETRGTFVTPSAMLAFDESEISLTSHGSGTPYLVESTATALASKDAQSVWFDTTLRRFGACVSTRASDTESHQETLWILDLIDNVYATPQDGSSLVSRWIQSSAL